MDEEKDSIDIVPLNTESTELVKNIVEENDSKKVKDLTELFNLNQSKRNVIRVMKLNTLLDNVSDTMLDRFEKRKDEFTNKDLLEYMTVVQNAIDKANKSVDLIDQSPMIHINEQNNVNIITDDISSLNRDSKIKVAEAIKSILDKSHNTDIEGEEDETN